MRLGIFQMNGCIKCMDETTKLIDNEELLLRDIETDEEDFDVSIIRCSDPDNMPEKIDIAIITGYATEESRHCLKELRKRAKVVYTFGSCSTSGGIFGLANQKGNEIFPVPKIIPVDIEIPGCLASVKELICTLQSKCKPEKPKLCNLCSKKPTCDFLEEVVRQVDLNEIDSEQCFNDYGYVCSGFVAKQCSERCIDFGTPCRGCYPLINRPGVRMLGMFGTMMGQMDVATEASAKGATDKLSDEEDSISQSFPDLVGTFFRFNLADSPMPRGKRESSGNLLSDVFIGRLIEEIPSITGMMGSRNFITLTLDVIEAYEEGSKIKVSDAVVKLRKKIRNLEKKYQDAAEKQDPNEYTKVTDQIRVIAGNMNLSNVYFGGFKTPIKGFDDFELYKSQKINFHSGTFKKGCVKYSTNDLGIITSWEVQE